MIGAGSFAGDDGRVPAQGARRCPARRRPTAIVHPGADPQREPARQDTRLPAGGRRGDAEGAGRLATREPGQRSGSAARTQVSHTHTHT